MITILMATYNGEPYLEKQLASIAGQSFADWRLVVRDDGSTDDTVGILKRFQEKFAGRVEIMEMGTPSGCAKKNFAILLQETAGAEYVMCCDQDDIWLPDKLARTWEEMTGLEERYGKERPLLVHGDVQVVDEQEKAVADSMFAFSNIPDEAGLAQLLVQNNVTGCTMMMNRSLAEAVAAFAQSDEVIMHDYLAALYAAVFGETAVICEPLLQYRQHQDNSVGAKNSNSGGYLFRRLKDGKRNYRDAMTVSRRQIAYFLKCFGGQMREQEKLSELSLMEAYAGLGDKSHLGRLLFYQKYGVWKSGTIRKVMQCLWG